MIRAKVSKEAADMQNPTETLEPKNTISVLEIKQRVFTGELIMKKNKL